MTITAQERDELIAHKAHLEAELIQATDALEQHSAEMEQDENWRMESLHRRGYRLSADVAGIRKSLANIDRLLAECTVATEPDPEPPAPAIARPTRFPATEARWSSICALTGARIRPGDLICSYRGDWALYAAAIADDDARRAAGVQRKADRQLADCFLTFAARLPIAA